ncbi:MAG: iron-sulfur cluster assembly accessory protein [Rhodospirillales bacterium]|jgi:iron-sulfur cluster assembly protein|nr:iron-sulfur cluster assembly accessory protein [Rhodospirillales bacterium]MBT4006427.1 iron-sulfur cluster assembly accessory protein [Rhodospirillales bacterium]MBT5075074.1 iron-sulfur cluster assembly accessory protein [Rhodospirillales bacterium]MBT5112641.1 iron-sulfur cluster assembly accessory protein [Rhodospirillales bacterium]MBT5673410.1 iron-sulfur cluster assembly accessory protein [Rhodospirillales bacterium]
MSETTPTNERPKPVNLTQAAADQVQKILDKSDKPALGLRISVGEGGCSGKTYVMDYAFEIGANDDVVEDRGMTIVIDPMAALFIFGTEIDYEVKHLQSGFVFRNPNETGRCGCGESFSI